jgi:hypothetical protein
MDGPVQLGLHGPDVDVQDVGDLLELHFGVKPETEDPPLAGRQAGLDLAQTEDGLAVHAGGLGIGAVVGGPVQAGD